MKRSLAVAVLVLCTLAPTRRAHATTIDFSSNGRCAGSAQGGFFSLSINTLAGDTFTVDGVARPGAFDMAGPAPLYAMGVPTTATSFVTTDSGSITTLHVFFQDSNQGFDGTLLETASSRSGGVPFFTVGSVLNFRVTFHDVSPGCQSASGFIMSATGGGGTPSPIPEPTTVVLFALGLLGACQARREARVHGIEFPERHGRGLPRTVGGETSR